MKNKKYIVISLLCLILIFMGIGFSLFSTTLNITGSSQGSGTFDVKITNVEFDNNNTSSGATNTTPAVGNDYAVTETTLSAIFNAPGDYITYNITATNRGTIDAVIDIETKMLDSTDSFELSCDVRDGTELLANGGHVTFPCRIMFKENVDSINNNQTANMSVSLKAVQKGTYQTKYVDQENSCFVSLVPGEINYYDMNNPDCGTNVDIPNGLRLPVSTVTSYEYNDDRCMANVSIIKTLRKWNSYTNQQACNAIKDEIEAATLEEILQSDLALYTDFTLGEEGQTRNLITKIGAGTFGVREIESVQFSNNITEIGKFAFQNNSLESLTLPGNVEKIGECAFCYNLISGTVAIPRSTNEVESGVFEQNKIQNVVFDRDCNLTTISEELFYKNEITSIVLPDKVENIGINAFSSNKISSLNFENNKNLKVIGQRAFGLNAITGSITFPKSVKEIGYMSFMGNNSANSNKISHVYFEEGSELEKIMSYAFRNNQIEGTLSLPDSLKTIAVGAFDNNRIETLNIGSGLTGIGNSAFTNNKLNNVTTLTTININMTESDWNTNVKSVDVNGNETANSATWYSSTPTINYLNG